MPAEIGVELIGNVCGRARERGRELQDDLLLIVEVRARLKMKNVVKLRFGDTGSSADGRMDVDSKRAADHKRGLELRELLEMHWDNALGGGIEIHAGGVAQKFGVEGADARAEWDAAEEALGEKEDEAGGQAGLTVLNAFGTGHGFTSLIEM